MEPATGPLLDHVHLITRRFDETRTFYRAVLGALGRTFDGEGDDAFWCGELYVGTPEAVTRGATHVHFAFKAPDRATVDRVHAAGLAAGGRDNGAPGERDYHPGYYGAFLLDPDDNNVEAVFHDRTGG